MRIIAGSLKGRKLHTPENDAIRPTSDRTRESVFNLLMHGQFGGEAIIGQRVADLCCGTGAVGLEAISRGASMAQCVDLSKKALELAKQNALHCGVVQQAHFLQADITKLPAMTQPFALVFMDPPYAKNLLAQTYDGLQKGGWLAQGSLLVVEQPPQAELPELAGAEHVMTREYGKKTAIHIWRVI